MVQNGSIAYVLGGKWVYPMQRLVLAVLLVGLAIAVAAFFVRGMTRTVPSVGIRSEDGERGGGTVQRLAFFVLVALILYVSVVGGA